MHTEQVPAMRASPALVFYPKEFHHPGFVYLTQVADWAGAPLRPVARVQAGYEGAGETGAIRAVLAAGVVQLGAILHQAGDAAGGFVYILCPAAWAGFFRPHVVTAHSAIDTARGD
jgi:hypothetical protein